MTQKSSHMVIIVWLDAVVTVGFMLVNGSLMLSAADVIYLHAVEHLGLFLYMVFMYN